MIFLMATSTVLLVVLQALWLRGAYNEERESFRKETNGLFRETIFSMHDSLIGRKIRPVHPDSAARVFRTEEDRVRVFQRQQAPPLHDSIFDFSRGKEARIQVIFEPAEKDSMEMPLGPIVRRIEGDNRSQVFIVRIGPDSLQKDSIEKRFGQALVSAGVSIPFTVHTSHSSPAAPRQIYGPGRFISETVRIGPLNEYTVSFSGLDVFLLKKIAPQILFSIFLTLLTAISFYVMYRSVRSNQKLMDLKNDFISNVTHELKTPVATVSVALEALRNFNALRDPQRTAEYLDIAQNELNRLTLMTDRILKTSVFEINGLNPRMEEVDVAGLVDEVISSMRVLFEKRRFTVDVSKTGADFRIRGSADDLKNVFFNLVDNAIKYSPDGATLTIRVAENPHSVAVTVTDTGCGIAPEYHKKVFEKFFRVPTGDLHNTKGYGLGLSYAASVVSRHDGKIALESTPGEGSSFTIDLPKAK